MENSNAIDISLCVYTNCTSCNSSDTRLLTKTLQSFIECFDIKSISDIVIYCDPHPNINQYETYIKQVKDIQKMFENIPFRILKTKSLSDGYYKSIINSKTKYIFQLEHDWIFLKQNILHTLDDILNEMEQFEIPYMRFNKRKNVICGSDLYLEEIKLQKFSVCKTPNMSNNPHIINRDFYYSNNYHKAIKIKHGSKGIEEELQAKYQNGYIYGGLNNEPTISHLDGKKKYL